MEARRDLASRYHGDARDVDGLLHHDLGGLRHHSGQDRVRGLIIRRQPANRLAAASSRSATSARISASAPQASSSALLVGTRSRLTSYLPITSMTTRAACFSASVMNTGSGARTSAPPSAAEAPVITAGACATPVASPSSAARPGLDLYADFLIVGARRIEDDLLQANRRVAAVGLVDDLLELVVRDDVQAIHRRDARALAVRAGAGRARWTARSACGH
jgi:hypothetical protein